VQPARVFQITIIKGLYAQTHSIDTGAAIQLQFAVVYGSRVYFDADFAGPLRQCSNDPADQSGIDDRRRAASKKNCPWLLLELGQLDFPQNALNVWLIGGLTRHRHCERTVIAALLTEWDVNVNAGSHTL